MRQKLPSNGARYNYSSNFSSMRRQFIIAHTCTLILAPVFDLMTLNCFKWCRIAHWLVLVVQFLIHLKNDAVHRVCLKWITRKKFTNTHTCTRFDLSFRIYSICFFATFAWDLHHFTMVSNRSKTNSNRNCNEKTA